MPFPRLRNVQNYCSSGTSLNIVREYDDNGVATVVSKPIHEELPPPSFYELGNLLKNKIPLQEVNSKVLGKNKLTLNVSEETKSQQTNNEVNDEN